MICYYIDTSEGQSGSPFLSYDNNDKPEIYGVHCLNYNVKNFNVATRFTDDIMYNFIKP